MPHHTENYYDAIADGYNSLHWQEQMHKLRVIIDSFPLDPEEKVLDVGCGTGAAGILSDNMIGVDPAEKLIRQAPYRTICAPAEQLPFDDNEFDVVVSITAIQNFDDIRKGLQEIRRVGKGRFVLTYLKRSQKAEQIEALISELFTVTKRIEQDKDIIFIIDP
jgi:ubiquinone/menaquinone biosynthesis C-methylase UbiE